VAKLFPSLSFEWKSMRFASSRFFIAFFFFSGPVLACPPVGGLPDYNCNGKAKISITGDSVVQGFGDTEKGNRGGYVTRFNEIYPDAKLQNFGVYAITTNQLLRKHMRGEYLREIANSDLVLIDSGRNDCREGESSLRTVRDLKRLVRWVKNNNAAQHTEDKGSSAGLPEKQPFIIIAAQIPHRDYRRACLEALNEELLRNRSSALPVLLRFDKLPSSILSSDGLHPSSSGYARMANRLSNFSQKRLLKQIDVLRPDLNSNGIYDLYEGLSESQF
jgi:lysophospholipase L1-like esterase